MLPQLFLTAVLVSSLSVNGLYTPRSRHLHARHAALHARAAFPHPAPVPAPVAEPLAQASASQRVKAKRSSKKCKPRPTSVAPSAASTSSAVAPANVAEDPSAQSSSSDDDKPQSAPATQPPSSASSPKTTKPKSTSTADNQPTNTPSGGGGGSSGGGNLPFGGSFHPDGMQGGDGTFYTPGLGACGGTNDESQDVAAVPFGLWDSVPGFSGGNPNNNPICNKQIDVSYQGKTVTVTVVDECMGCNNQGSVDMSPHAFQQLADESVGRIHGITWKWHGA